MITGTYKIVNDYKDLQQISGNLVAYYNERAREGYITNVCFFWPDIKRTYVFFGRETSKNRSKICIVLFSTPLNICEQSFGLRCIFN